MTSNSHTPTAEQLRAIRTVGKSVIVSAAAGSGKTAVLAKRCVYLICDAPPPHRCDADALLVLTFTEAAATEMRSRVIAELRRRLAEHPSDERLQRQTSLVEVAQISTIHSFCLWLVRRWFPHLEVDPTATVLDAEEAVTLRREVAIEVFGKRYEAAAADDDVLGVSEAGDESGGKQDAFRRLLDDYGLGEDSEIVNFVIRISEFLDSLPDPEAWMHEASLAREEQLVTVVLSLVAELESELQLQREHCAGLLEKWTQLGEPAAPYRERVVKYLSALDDWVSRLGAALHHSPGRLRAFDEIVAEIVAFAFERIPSRKGPPLSVNEEADKENAKNAYEDVRERLLKSRLKARFGSNSESLFGGMRRIAPYTTTILDLAREFRNAYSARKRRMNVLDFADLERFAFQLLCANPERSDDRPLPSDIARSLHRRFAHVLVDEFQDINPIQQTILHLASRESDDSMAGNLFVVGDVKQSIYRFRLAEPRIFLERLKLFRKPALETGGTIGDKKPSSLSQRPSPLPLSLEGRGVIETASGNGEALFLTLNFRSRPAILEAVNEVFRRLMMGDAGELRYDRDAELRPARESGAGGFSDRVEVHLLQRAITPSLTEESEEADVAVDDAPGRGRNGPSDPLRWTTMEREGHLIGTRIREWLEQGVRGEDGKLLAYRDIAVLLRSARINAERVASRLSRMGIPAFAQLGGSLLSALEVREVVAALRVLDNARQDIPLAATLRSGIFGDRFSENDLVEMRLFDPPSPYHEALRAYAANGPDAELRARIATVLRRMNRLREDARRSTVADTILRLYDERGYMAMACAMPNGSQRRGNLLKFYELARKFSTFRRQGLHRFLSFLESVSEADEQIDYAAPLGAAENVVRVMTIHQAKGLEFPVVFLAGLGNQFNLGDRQGRIIFDRRAKLGLKVVDPQRMVEYPSAVHQLVAAEIERATREEELRILYVAMTRAEEKLVLVGTTHQAADVKESTIRSANPNRPRLSQLDVASAKSPMDWLVPILMNSIIDGTGNGPNESPLFDVSVHLQTDMESWDTANARRTRDEVREAVAQLDPLPASEPRAADDAIVEETVARLDRDYPFAASSSLPATLAASQMKTGFDFLADPDLRATPSTITREFARPRSKYADQAATDSMQRGIVTHQFLQWVDFAAAARPDGVVSEARRLVACGRLSPLDSDCLPVDALNWFMFTPLAQSIRAAGDKYRREFPFITTEPLHSLDPTINAPPEDRVLVRGIIDGILSVADGIELVDFKTDDIAASEVAAKAELYRPQMSTYARSMKRLWRRPVRACWLVFLSPRAIHHLDVTPGNLDE